MPEVIPATQFSYVLSATSTNGSNGVTPYTAYEFQVLARNGAGDVTSAFSETNTNTFSAGKLLFTVVVELIIIHSMCMYSSSGNVM